ncbi:hypothetical protein SLA2020_304230 [Shorea laevis]
MLYPARKVIDYLGIRSGYCQADTSVPEVDHTLAQNGFDSAAGHKAAGHKASGHTFLIFHCELKILARPSSVDNLLYCDHMYGDSHNVCSCLLLEYRVVGEVVA